MSALILKFPRRYKRVELSKKRYWISKILPFPVPIDPEKCEGSKDGRHCWHFYYDDYNSACCCWCPADLPSQNLSSINLLSAVKNMIESRRKGGSE